MKQFMCTAALALLSLMTPVFAQGPGCSGTIISSGGRKIAIVEDSSGSMLTNDPQNLRITAGKALAASLLSTDQVTVIDFDDSSQISSPLGPPSSANFSKIDSSGGTYIASGVNLAIKELTKAGSGPTAGLTGIVVLTDGEDSYQAQLITALKNATALGIRVSFGFLNKDLTSQNSGVLAAILQTGGIYSTISNPSAIATFNTLVQSHGLTESDNSGTQTLLFPNLVIAGNVSSTTGPKTFTYDAEAGEILNFTLTAVAKQDFTMTLTGGASNTTTGAAGVAILRYTATSAQHLELAITSTNATSGVFTIQIRSNLNRTIAVCSATSTTTPPYTLPPQTNTSSTAAPTLTITPNITLTGTPYQPTVTVSIDTTVTVTVSTTIISGTTIVACPVCTCVVGGTTYIGGTTIGATLTGPGYTSTITAAVPTITPGVPATTSRPVFTGGAGAVQAAGLAGLLPAIVAFAL